MTWREFLDLCTFLGGVSAVWFLLEKLLPAATPETLRSLVTGWSIFGGLIVSIYMIFLPPYSFFIAVLLVYLIASIGEKRRSDTTNVILAGLAGFSCLWSLVVVAVLYFIRPNHDIDSPITFLYALGAFVLSWPLAWLWAKVVKAGQ
ncbi:MAG TPA: hypothetical protein VF713_19115 [Thermoanaerobaculia bacterium]